MNDQAEGSLPERGSLLDSSGTGVAVTALKPSEDGKGAVIRAVNLSERASDWNISVPAGFGVFGSKITEQKGEPLSADKAGIYHTPMKKKEIRTLRIESI